MKRKGKSSGKELNETYMVRGEFDTERLYSFQKYLALIYEKCLHDKTVEEFFRIKYRQNIYEVGEHLHLYDASEKKPYVVKLTGIYRLNREGVGIVLKVEWLMKKEDLPYHKFTKYFEHLSVAEVFPSGQDDFVPVEAIMRKCHILTAVEYESLSNAGDAIHFSRAVFNRGTLQLEPHPETWTKQCYCQMPINPDVPYIQCDKCEHWFHHECIDNELLLNDDKFICKDCP